MIRFHRLSLLTALLAPSFIVGCGGVPTAQGPSSPELLETSLRVFPTTLSASDTATVVITVRNPTDRAVEFEAPCGGLTLRVYRAGAPVDPRFCNGGRLTVRFAPGEVRERRELFPVLRYAGHLTYRALAPDAYALVAGWDMGPGWDERRPLLAVSDTVSVVVRAE